MCERSKHQNNSEEKDSCWGHHGAQCYVAIAEWHCAGSKLLCFRALVPGGGMF
jgi:hypothetical protein